MNPVKKFYDQNSFPGHYSLDSLQSHYFPNIKNPYLICIEHALEKINTVIDVGCGTGLITNLFALKLPNTHFTALDFSNGIDYAMSFAKQHSINNVTFVKQDFTDYQINQQFGAVICQGVLHHMPNWEHNVQKLKQLIKPGGVMILGLYHPMGKVVKRFVDIDYGSLILQADQELHPFELSFDQKQVNSIMGDQFVLVNSYPTQFALGIKSFLNYRSGGLVTYIYRKHKE